jgi:hypothetical protein
MTAVGKILVFLNLVFSLVVGAFVVLIYMARTNWVHEYNTLKAQNGVLVASADTYRNEAVKAQQEADAKVNKGLADLKNVQADLQTELTVNANLSKELDKLKQQNTKDNAQASLSMTEVTKRQEDVSKLREQLKKETEANNVLVKKNTELQDATLAAQIERKATQDMNNRLEAQLQRMAKDMARMRATGGGGGTATARGSSKNPPAESVEGLVKNTDSSGLMTLTIGSDAGLTKGHTLELFRLNPSAPSQSRYLGTVRILEATATQAVAQPVGRLTAPAQPGDRVASRILGN